MRITTYKTMLCQDTNHNVLVKDMSTNYPRINRIDNPGAIAEIMRNIFNLDYAAEEYLYMIAVNTKCSPLGFFEVSHGTVNASLINPRELFIRALLTGATSIFLCHNHPSSDSTPSQEDIKVTRRIKEAGDLLGIKLLDHIIIGNSEYFSFKEKNII